MTGRSISVKVVLLLSLPLLWPAGCAAPGMRGTAGEQAAVNDQNPSGHPDPSGQGVNPRAVSLFETAMRKAETGSIEEAIAALESAIDLAPDLSVPYNNLGALYRQKGLVDKAIEAYRMAIRRQPDYAAAYNNLGLAYRAKGRFKQAEESYRKAIELEPALAEAHYNLGVLYDLYLDQPARAVHHYRRYIELGGIHRDLVESWMGVLKERLNE